LIWLIQFYHEYAAQKENVLTAELLQPFFHPLLLQWLFFCSQHFPVENSKLESDGKPENTVGGQ